MLEAICLICFFEWVLAFLGFGRSVSSRTRSVRGEANLSRSDNVFGAVGSWSAEVRRLETCIWVSLCRGLFDPWGALILFLQSLLLDRRLSRATSGLKFSAFQRSCQMMGHHC